MSKELPRGVRNFNPGNLEWGDKWQGLVPRTQATDHRFAQFKTAAWGIRALAVTLITYYDKHGIKTIKGAINRWAPPVENNTGAYVNQVSKAVGVISTEKVNFHDYNILRPMVEAIIRHENGSPTRYGRKPHNNINEWYDDLMIDEGLRLAGIVKPAAKVSREGVAVGTVAVAGGGAAITELVTQVAPALSHVRTANEATDGLPSWVRVVIVLLTVAAAAAGAYISWRKYRQSKAVN